jgi:hypothetical protein
MKKYKCIKEYPSVKLGTIVTSKSNMWFVDKNNNCFIEDEIINYPEYWSEYLFTTLDNVEIYKGMSYWIVNTSLKIIREEPKHLQYGDPFPCLSFFNYNEAEKYCIQNQKTLKDYENILLNDNSEVKEKVSYGTTTIGFTKGFYYSLLKENDPKLYWTKVFNIIANDLNDGWIPKRNNQKYFIGITSRSGQETREILIHLTVTYGLTYFKSRELAHKAEKLIGQYINYILS